MDLELLGQYRALKSEIRGLERKIEQLEEERGTVTDKVTASSRDFPYTRFSVKIEGINREKQQVIRKRLLSLEERKLAAEKLALKIEQYISVVEDSKIRGMMERYADGMTWERIGELYHCERTTAAKKVAKYLKKH